MALIARAQSSAERTCRADTECATITNPGHPDPEYDLIVHNTDAAELGAASEIHLERCGAFFHHEAIDAFRVIEPRCLEGRCQAEETVMHVDG